VAKQRVDKGVVRARQSHGFLLSVRALLALAAGFSLALACGGSGGEDTTPGSGASDGGSAAEGAGSSGGSTSTGSGSSVVVSGGTSSGGSSTNDPSDAGFEACTGSANEQEEIPTPLDIYFVFDRTGSMGTDCAYVRGEEPPVRSKACFATYAFNDYLIDVEPVVDTRLAFQFMSLPNKSCDGTAYSVPRIGLRSLPLAEDDELIQTISDERFRGGYGTEIEGALRGIAAFTRANVTEGRGMIGVLMTDGDPEGACEDDNDVLAGIIADHFEETGLRTFIIGMNGANERRLEQLAIAGGAEPHDDWCGSIAPPCHYFNVGDGSGEAIASALSAIIKQATPLPCAYPVAGFRPPEGETVDFSKVNVELTGADGEVTTIGWVEDEGHCPSDEPAWYYDDRDQPTEIRLCKAACELVTGQESGSRVTVVVGCKETIEVVLK
jgi:hypothetical protein